MRWNEYNLEFVVTLVFFQMGWTGSTLHNFEFSTPAWKSFSGKTQKKHARFAWFRTFVTEKRLLVLELLWTKCLGNADLWNHVPTFLLFIPTLIWKKGAHLSTFQAMKAETLLLSVFLFYILVQLSFNGQPKMVVVSVCWGLRPTLTLAQGKTPFLTTFQHASAQMATHQ